MTSVKFLEYQYSKSKFSTSSKRLFSFSSKQYSSLLPTYKLNVHEMRRVFDKFDRDSDGKISKEDYKATLRAIGKPEMVSEVYKIFKFADTNNDGYIDFDEFMALHTNGGDGGVRTLDIRNAFRAFDEDRDGRISAEELYKMLDRLGERCTIEECKSMIKGVDMDGDGFVNMSEFMTMMTRTMVRC